MQGDQKSQGDPLLPGNSKLTQGQSVGRGRYLLRRKIGHGGMGIVWEAEDTRLGETVALKFLPDQIAFDVEAFENLRRETLKSRQLTHPNILRIHDLVEEENEPPFLAMEYVDGANLSKLRAERPKQLFSWETLKPIVTQLCDALDYAHSQKLIHRDLKPANILMDQSGRLKLADLGLTAAAADSLGRITHHTTSGTPRYMSPQHLSGLKPRVSDDIYSLGATLYELLTSKPPFHSGDISFQVLNVEPPPLAKRLEEEGLTNDVPQHVSATILACLAKAPEERPRSAREVKQRLLGNSADGLPAIANVRQAGWLKLAAVLAVISCLGWLAVNNPRTGDAPPSAIVRPVALPAPEPSNITIAEPTTAALANLQPLVPSATEAGFKSELLGNDFRGWTARPLEAWKIEDGLVTGTANNGEHIFLHRRQDYGDFELRFAWKATGGRGAMLVYRCPRDEDDTLKRRYRTPLSGPETGNLHLSDQGRQLPDTRPGQITEISDGKWRLMGTLNESESQIRTHINVNDWNELILIVRSNRFAQFINGVRVLELTDNLPTAILEGPLYFRVAADENAPITLQFKRLRIRELPSLSTGTDAQGGASAVPLSTKATPPVPARTSDGFRTIFNGQTLADWQPTRREDWSVVNGALTTRCSVTNQHNLIQWREEIADFELRFSMRTTGRASVRLRENRLESGAGDFYGVLINEQYPGATALPKGERLSIVGPAAFFVQEEGKYTKAGALRVEMADVLSLYHTNDWNDWVIIARGNRYVHYLNGRLVQDFTDKDSLPGQARGKIGFRLSTQLGPPETEMQLKNIRLRSLPPALGP